MKTTYIELQCKNTNLLLMISSVRTWY